jgi:outer membrane protein assembly factor BamA
MAPRGLGVHHLGGNRADGTFPYQEYFVELTFPSVIDRHLRLVIRPSYNREAFLTYWGLGNASIYAPRWTSIDPSKDPAAYDQAVRFNEYTFLRPGLRVDGRIEIARPFYVNSMTMFTQNVADVAVQSKITEDRNGASGSLVQSIVSGPDHYGQLVLGSELVYDSRDSEAAPERGMFHKLGLRASPGPGGELPYAYGGFNATARFYAPVVRRRLSLALRLIGDVLFGHAPLNELARYDTMSYAVGGIGSVRGVPALRYYGRVKVIGNAEVRAKLFRARVLREDVWFGLAAFFDAGRVWADYSAQPLLDGTGLGVHWGTGGGPRIQIGEAFVVRGDIAYSPEARPIGAYLTAGHTF